MRGLLTAVVIAMGLTTCAADKSRTATDEQLEMAANQALEVGDFGRAIALALPRAKAGDSDFQFSVGYLSIMWIEAPAPKEPPKYSLEEALSWIRQAAAQGSPQAAGFLRSGYEWGRYTLPKNEVLEACWRKVESGEQEATACTAENEAIPGV